MFMKVYDFRLLIVDDNYFRTAVGMVNMHVYHMVFIIDGSSDYDAMVISLFISFLCICWEEGEYEPTLFFFCHSKNPRVVRGGGLICPSLRFFS